MEVTYIIKNPPGSKTDLVVTLLSQPKADKGQIQCREIGTHLQGAHSRIFFYTIPYIGKIEKMHPKYNNRTTVCCYQPKV